MSNCFYKIPDHFLFKDFSFTANEAFSILQEIKQGKKTFQAVEVENLVKHYLTLFEVLNFIHYSAPDLLAINELKDTKKEIISFANDEFMNVFNLKKNPEGKDLFTIFDPEEKESLQQFIKDTITNNKTKFLQDRDNIRIEEKSHKIIMPITLKSQGVKKLYEISISLNGKIISLSDNTPYFKGFIILIGRDVTNRIVQEKMADFFTNIPKDLRKDFEKEARNRVLFKQEPHLIRLKNVFVLTGFSDISNSADWRYQALQKDKKEGDNRNTELVNEETEKINICLHRIWKKYKVKFNKLNPGVFLLTETDGLDYVICFLKSKNKHIDLNLKHKLQVLELELMLEVSKTCRENNFSLKHLIITHNQEISFYFEEKFEHRFKIDTSDVDFFIKKKRLEKAMERDTKKRIVQEGMLTVTFDTIEEKQSYLKVVTEVVDSQNTVLEEGMVESLSGLQETYFIRM